MRSAALLRARRRGAEVFPVLALDLESRGLDLGRVIVSTAIRPTALGQVTHVSASGGWSEITYGPGIADNALAIVEATVDVNDPKGTLADLLETYDPLGSAARIDWAAAGLVAEDWEPGFRGVLADKARNGLVTRLILRTDDTVLRTPIPSGTFLLAEWGSAYDTSIFGTAEPLVLGLHDSFSVTMRGAVPLVNIRYDKDLGYWWEVSASRMVEVTRLYFDGVPQGTGGWSVLHGVYGGSQRTIVAFAEGYQPAKDVIVSADCKGPDETGGSAGLTLTGCPDQLRAIIEEWARRRPPLGAWRGPESIIDAESWDAASEYFALHLFESARRFGADQTPASAAELIKEFCDQFRWAGIYWNELGKLAFLILDPDDVDPDGDPDGAAHFRLDKHHAGGVVPVDRGDTREVYTHVRQPFLWLAADSKYASAYEADDVAALREKVVLSIDAPWSQARYNQDPGTLNPAPPADPEIPS